MQTQARIKILYSYYYLLYLSSEVLIILQKVSFFSDFIFSFLNQLIGFLSYSIISINCYSSEQLALTIYINLCLFLNGLEPVSSVTLFSTTTTLISGQQMNLTCATSYCNPPAYITWYKSSENVTNQSNYTINRMDGLAETVSLLLITVGKNDTGKQIFCRASNTPDKTITSNTSTLNVLCKCIFHSSVFRQLFCSVSVNNVLPKCNTKIKT